MQWSECLCYICLKNFVDKERKNTCIKRAVRFVFTWRTKVPDATTDRNCLISLILSFFDALWTTAQYVQGCQQDHLWCRHYCNKTVENFFFKWISYKYFCCVRTKKKSLAQVLLLKVTNFKDFQFTSDCDILVYKTWFLVCSVIHTGELHILVAKSCHTSSKEIFNVLWQLAVLAMDCQLFCHILKYPVPFNQTKLFNTTTFKSCVNISAMNESLTNHNKLMANCDIPLWIQLGQVQYKFLWFCKTAQQQVDSMHWMVR